MDIRKFLKENCAEFEDMSKTLPGRILAIIRNGPDGESVGVIKNRMRNRKETDIVDALQVLHDNGLIEPYAKKHPITGRTSAFFRATQKETT